jgi:hypothetical protein
MTPEQEKLLYDTTRKLDQFLDVFSRFHFIDKDVFQNPVYFNGKVYFKDGTVLSTGSSSGMKFGNATTEKLAFYGVTPVDQPNAITAPSGGATVDSQARTAISTIISRFQELGLTA